MKQKHKAQSQSFSVLVLAFLGLIFLSTQACSLFSRKESQGSMSMGSWGPTHVSVPVEIADEINKISELGPSNEVGSGQWVEGSRGGNSIASSKTEIKPHGNFKEPTMVIDSKVPLTNTQREQYKNIPQRRTASAENPIQYKVRSGDTLMKIAFEKYGDLRRWKEIYNSNRSILKNDYRLSIGMILIVEGVEYVVIEKNGKPYLIKRHDTLAQISRQLYGSIHYWPSLWSNNKQLIRNPNKIYAGFHLYYESLDKIKNKGMERSHEMGL